MARPGRGQSQIRDRDPKTGLAGSETLARRTDGGPRYCAARKLAAGADYLLVIPDHGRVGCPDVWTWLVQPVESLARHAVPIPTAAHVRNGDGTGGLFSRARGL